MTERLNNLLAKCLDSLLCLVTAFITGVRPKLPQQLAFSSRHKLYYANHNSHGDFVLVWISLPKRWRMNTRPVAGADYWLGNSLKRFIAQRVFKALLIDRHSHDPMATIAQMGQVLQSGQSLIIFPEGTRNTQDDVVLLPFKSGLYHLAQQNPEVKLVPVWIDNIQRVLPKGHLLPVPLLCQVNIGQGLQLAAGESKNAFLARARQALLDLAPASVQAAAQTQAAASQTQSDLDTTTPQEAQP